MNKHTSRLKDKAALRGSKQPLSIEDMRELLDEHARDSAILRQIACMKQRDRLSDADAMTITAFNLAIALEETQAAYVELARVSPCFPMSSR